MNIFVLHNDPVEAAKLLGDKHIVKMILESTQMLSTAHHVLDGYTPFYKPTHINHPCVVWARESLCNYYWLCQHALSMCSEYTRRYKKVHKCQLMIQWFVNNPPHKFLGVKQTNFVLAIPEAYKQDDAVESYRQYYKFDKYHIAKYKYNEVPIFLL